MMTGLTDSLCVIKSKTNILQNILLYTQIYYVRYVRSSVYPVYTLQSRTHQALYNETLFN